MVAARRIALFAPALALVASLCSISPAGATPAERLAPAPDWTEGNYAGYIAQLAGGWKRSVAASVVVPDLGDCSVKQEGIDTEVTINSHDGQSWAGGRIDAYCDNGVATRYAELTAVPGGEGEVLDGLAGGDRIEIAVRVIRNSTDIQVVITDQTQDRQIRTRYADVTPDEAEVIQYHHVVPGGHVDVLRHNTAVRDVRVSGHDLAHAHPVGHTLVNEAENTQIKPSKIVKGGNFTFRYSPLTIPAFNSDATSASTGPTYAPPASTGYPKFRVFQRPVSKYTNGSCAADLSGYADGSYIGDAAGCDFQANFYPTTLIKHTVPDGGWISWGSPPDTEDSDPAVAAVQPDVTRIVLNYDHPQKLGGVEIEPDPFRRHRFTAEFYRGLYGTGALRGSITRSADGRAGAKLLAARVGRTFASIVITSNDGVGFAIAQIRGLPAH